MAEVVLGFGSNLGARRAIFRTATRLLAAEPGCRVLSLSSLYETPPLTPPQPAYLNAAVRVTWEGEVEALFVATQRIESWLGRERRERWGARTLDIDILHTDQGPLARPGLEVPHRALGERTFALAPLLDVAPELGSVWAPVLNALGGPPPLAQPGWMHVDARQDEGASDWLDDDGELVSLALELAASAMSDPISQQRRAFEVPLPIAAADLALHVERTLHDLAREGFALRAAVVLGREPQCLRGVWFGESGSRYATSRHRPVTIEQRPGGARRVRVRGSKP